MHTATSKLLIEQPGLGQSETTNNVFAAAGFWALKLLVTLWLFLSVVYAQAPGEYQIKAAFLFHFAQLVDWPPSAFGDNKDAFKMCTIGDDPFHGDLDGVVEGKPIGSRATHVRHLTQIQDIHDCQILFIGKKEMKKLSPLLAELGNDPVMTVGETENFVQQGGIIGFSYEDNKIRFEINLIAAEHAKLKISSRLLLLAKNVVGNLAAR